MPRETMKKPAAKGTRSRNIFSPNSEEPFKLSRSKLDLFLQCPRCFYLDRRLGVGQPSGPPFTLNNAVDTLLKREFDACRRAGKQHPLMKKFGVNAVPFRHPKLDEWRENFKGVQALHTETNFLVTGAVDDLWVEKNGTVIVVDYKATSTAREINLDDPWKAGYKRQMEIYQWLLRRHNLTVSDVGYFVFVNGDADKNAFDGKLEFKSVILPYVGDDSWVDDALLEAHKCLCASSMPAANSGCEWCAYRKAAKAVETNDSETPSLFD
jgi:hypothetical protein